MIQREVSRNAADRYIAGMYWFRRPLLTIVVPVFNVERFLPGCLESIRRQRFTDYECLLIDDGSTDGSGEICNQYVYRDRRFRAFHTKNRGLSEARNYGTTLAQGMYLTYVDADDLVESGYLQDLYSVMMASGADIVCVQEREEVECGARAACAQEREEVVCGARAACAQERDKAVRGDNTACAFKREEIIETTGTRTAIKRKFVKTQRGVLSACIRDLKESACHNSGIRTHENGIRTTGRKMPRGCNESARKARKRFPDYTLLSRWLALWFCIRGHSDVPLISAWGKLYRTEFAQQFFFPRGRNYEDLAETWQMVLHADKVAFCPNRDYVYRLREGSITHTKTLRNLYDYVWALERRSEGLKGNREAGQEGSRFGYFFGTVSEILRFPGFYLDHVYDALPIVDLYYRNIHAKPFGRVICRVYRFGMKHKAEMWKVRTLKRRINHLLTGAPLGEGPSSGS